MKLITEWYNKLRKNQKGQIFLVCTVVIIIYLLSFLTIIYELNMAQYNRNTTVNEFQAAYENFRTETGNFMKGLIANYSATTTIINNNITAGQLLDEWLSFAEQQMFSRGFFAVFEIIDLVPITTPIELVKANGLLSVRANIDVYMECNYLTFETELQYFYRYSLSYSNSPTSALITLTFESSTEKSTYGYADVRVNGNPCINLYNGSYLYSTPLVVTDNVLATTIEKIIVNLIVQ